MDHLRQPRVTLSVSNSGSAALVVRDENGNPRMDAGYDGILKRAFIAYNGKVIKEIRDHYNNPS
jgi:hypothetical protein